MDEIKSALSRLIQYVESENLKGYDPYDTLNTLFSIRLFGTYGSAVAIQLQKRNPINIRPILGIKKEVNPKGMGLFLKAYSILYNKTRKEKYLEKAAYIFKWLNDNYSKGYSGKCWGYNFDWASPGSYIRAYTPSVVVTSFVIDGINEYYHTCNSSLAADCILSAAKFIKEDIPVSKFNAGLSFSYTHLSKDACYNASLLAAEVLAKAHAIKPNQEYLSLIKSAVRFVLSKQKPDGSWYYSFNPVSQNERKQIDFHQGFILISLNNILNLSGILDSEINQALTRGLNFYKTYQFLPNGRSLWRLPSKWPVDIHNQSQGIITFSKLKDFDISYGVFAKRIAKWTIENMQSNKGYFYYRMTPLWKNRISYMRWSQAWMMLALTELLDSKDD